MTTTTFDRGMLATLTNLHPEALKSQNKRGFLPTLRDDRTRTACTPFDALALMASEFFTRDDGLPHRSLSKLLYQHLPELARLATRVDAGEKGLVLGVIQRDGDDRLLVGGPFVEIAEQLMRATDPPSRVTFVSLTGAAAAIRQQARAHGLGGDLRFAPSEAEAARLAPPSPRPAAKRAEGSP